MDTTTLIIIPKGTITNRILVMVSSMVISKHIGIKIKMIWDHKVPYDALFLNNIELVDISYFRGKKYYYNPNVDQNEICNCLKYNENCDMNVIVETSLELVHNTMSHREYCKLRNNCYLNMLREDINGMLLGQVNLIDYPKEIHWYCTNGDFSTKMERLCINNSMLDVKNDELQSYVRALIYSRATILVNTKSEIDLEYIEASKISLIPVVNTQKVEYEYFIKNDVKGLFGFEVVINPDVKKITLL
jgi:hypothetical protein